MTGQVEAMGPVPTRWQRLLNFPLVRIIVAILFIAIPIAAVQIPLNLFVKGKSLRGLGALLLAAVVLVAYRTYVRVIEKRPVSELSGRRAGLESGSGLALGALLFSATIGILAAIGVYRVTGNNDWQSIPTAGGAAAAQEQVPRGRHLHLGIRGCGKTRFGRRIGLPRSVGRQAWPANHRGD